MFWDGDTQVDFMLPDGKLPVPDAEMIAPNLARLADYVSTTEVCECMLVEVQQTGGDRTWMCPRNSMPLTTGNLGHLRSSQSYPAALSRRGPTRLIRRLGASVPLGDYGSGRLRQGFI